MRYDIAYIVVALWQNYSAEWETNAAEREMSAAEWETNAAEREMNAAERETNAAEYHIKQQSIIQYSTVRYIVQYCAWRITQKNIRYISDTRTS